MHTTQNTDICTCHRAACTHGPVRTHACTHTHPVDVTKGKKITFKHIRSGPSHTQFCSWLMYLEQILIS